jgi:small neutral amino acid transporter SnatA (MarC family)
VAEVGQGGHGFLPGVAGWLFLLYHYGLRRMASSVAVNILNLVPVFGVIGAVVVNGESIRPAQAAGGVIIVGVALGMIERGREATAGEAGRGGSSGAATAQAEAATGHVPNEPEAAVPAAEGVIDGAR